jgi:hypothetical protein
LPVPAGAREGSSAPVLDSDASMADVIQMAFTAEQGAAAIWSFHEAGYSAPQILAEYPTLTKADVETAIAYEHRKRTG